MSARQGDVLLHRAQRGDRERCRADAVEADDGDILGDPAAASAERLQRPYRESVRCSEDRVERDVVVDEIERRAIPMIGRSCSFMTLT